MSPATLITPLLLTAALGVSFFFHGGQNIAYAPAVILLLLAALISAWPRAGRAVFLPAGGAVLATLAFWIYISISLTWSNVPFASLVTWVNITALPLVLLTLLCHPNRQTLIRHTGVLVAGVTVITALYTLWQFFVDGLDRAPGVLPNPNNMATVLNLSLLPLLALAATGQGKPRLMAAVACLVLFAGLLATGSRGGLVCFGLGIFILGTAFFPHLKSHGKAVAGFAAVTALIFTGFLLFSHTALERSLSIFGDPVIDYSSYERLEIWKASYAMLLEHLFTGTGLGTFYLYYPAHRPLGDTSSMGHWAHFDALQFGIECGVLTMVLFYVVIAAWLVRGIKAWSNKERRMQIAGCMAALAALVLHAHIEFQFYIISILIIAAVLMARLYTLSTSDEDRDYITLSPAPRERLIWRGALLVTASLLALTTISTAAGYYYTGRAQAVLRQGDLDGFFTQINKAYSFAPRSFTDTDLRVAAVYLDILAQPPVQMTAADRLEIYDNTAKLLDDAQKSNPALADIDHKRAKLYMRATDDQVPDRLQQAAHYWQIALAKNPQHYIAREEYARLLISQGKAEDAYNLIQDGLKRPMTRPAQMAFQTLSAQLEPLVRVKHQFQRQLDTTP